MRVVLAIAFGSLAAVPIAAQEGTAHDWQVLRGDKQQVFSIDRAFALLLPVEWQQLTPDQARSLSKRPEAGFPPDLVSARPLPFYPFADVTRWLEEGFDGRCLTIAKVAGEPDEGEEGVAQITSMQDTEGGLWQRTVLDARATEYGEAQHPVFECITRMVPAAGGEPLRSLEVFVPTNGDTLILGFRAFEDEFDALLPDYRALASTLRVSRPARGNPSVGQRLLYPAVIGALVGIALMVLRKRAIA